MMEESLLQEQLHQHVLLLLTGLLMGGAAGFIAWQNGFFKFFQPSFLPVIRGKDVLKGFLVFIVAELIAVPALAVVIMYTATGQILAVSDLSPHEKGWFNALIILGGFLAVWRVYFDLPAETRRQLWTQTNIPWYKQVVVGMGSWFISYPLVLAVGQLIAIAVLLAFRQPTIDQVAAKHLKSVLSNPLLFAITAFEVVCLVPFMEEFLFRGLLQNWLKKKFHQATASVMLTSFIFALFHYAGNQGVTNIELLSSLFMLSCFLGFLYEKQRSLWASMGLHGFFNLISILLIFRS